MFEIKQEKDQVSVTVKLQKRILAKDPKIYIYMADAFREAKKLFSDLNISKMADNTQVASTVRAPHEVTWKFKIIEKQEELSKPLNKKIKKLSKKQQLEALDELVELSQEMGGYDKELVTDLTSDEECVTIEETTEKVQEPTE